MASTVSSISGHASGLSDVNYTSSNCRSNFSMGCIQQLLEPADNSNNSDSVSEGSNNNTLLVQELMKL